MFIETYAMLDNFIFLKEMFDELIIKSILVILTRDPCKKCLVSACCSQMCEERSLIENFIGRSSSLKSRKRIAWYILTFITIYIPCVIFVLFYKT
ncbi:MAG: hypothetical protein ACFFG0_00455 [Candidatus Thorarchaeota archaeon]